MTIGNARFLTAKPNDSMTARLYLLNDGDANWLIDNEVNDYSLGWLSDREAHDHWQRQ